MSKKIDYNKWHSGPPPSIGWWPASWNKNNRYIRWWDGAQWSEPATKNDSPERAAKIAKRPGWVHCCGGDIHKPPITYWQHRPESWPARSRT